MSDRDPIRQALQEDAEMRLEELIELRDERDAALDREAGLSDALDALRAERDALKEKVAELVQIGNHRIESLDAENARVEAQLAKAQNERDAAKAADKEVYTLQSQLAEAVRVLRRVRASLDRWILASDDGSTIVAESESMIDAFLARLDGET